MPTTIPQRQLRNNNAEILDRVEAGESFVVTRNGVAVADVVPHSRRRGPPRFPSTRELLTQRSSHPGPDSTAWLRDIRDADSFFDDDTLIDRG